MPKSPGSAGAPRSLLGFVRDLERRHVEGSLELEIGRAPKSVWPSRDALLARFAQYASRRGYPSLKAYALVYGEIETLALLRKLAEQTHHPLSKKRGPAS